MPDNQLYDVHIGVIGQPGVGKTAYIQRLIHNHFSLNYHPTIGTEHHLATITLADEKMRVHFWDNGAYSARQKNQFCFSRQHGFLVMIDVTKADSLIHLKEWLQETDRYANEYRIISFIGNKCDQVDQRAIDQQTIRDWVDQLGHAYFDISVKDNINNEEPLLSLLQIILKRHVDVWQSALAAPNREAQKAIIMQAKKNYKLLNDQVLLERLNSHKSARYFSWWRVDKKQDKTDECCEKRLQC